VACSTFIRGIETFIKTQSNRSSLAAYSLFAPSLARWHCGALLSASEEIPRPLPATEVSPKRKTRSLRRIPSGAQDLDHQRAQIKPISIS